MSKSMLGSFLLLTAACTNQAATPDTGAAVSPLTQSAAAASANADENRPPPHHRGPPPAAYEACASKAVNDACTITFGDKTINGKCASPPPDAKDARIACRPDGPPPGGPGGPHGPHGKPPAEAFTACDGKAADATCSVKFGDRTMDGTCLAPPAGAPSGETRLACVPKRGPKPPPPAP